MVLHIDAKNVFLDLRAELVVINDAPNGRNINVKCGSTHPEILSKVVVGYEADLGLAYDGDADRLIAVDKFGNILVSLPITTFIFSSFYKYFLNNSQEHSQVLMLYQQLILLLASPLMPSVPKYLPIKITPFI